MRRYLALLLPIFLMTSAAAMAADQGRSNLFLIFFQPWSAKLDAGNQKMIQTAVTKANTIPQSQVTVLGYADMEGSAKANLDLTKNRVDAVKQMLVRDGFPEDRITVKPFGSVKPIGDSQESRRVEITIRAP